MWVPKEVSNWFKISKESVDALREELAAVRAERDSLRLQLVTLQNNFEWVRMQINTLQVERSSLLGKLYGLTLPAPELIRTAAIADRTSEKAFSFEDIGEDLAKQLGLPSYTKQ